MKAVHYNDLRFPGFPLCYGAGRHLNGNVSITEDKQKVTCKICLGKMEIK